MPYIKNDRREEFDHQIQILTNHIMDSGELCYCVYKIMKIQAEKNMRFQTLSNVVSEVECAKLEFYRRIVAPYEDKKIKENGDVI